MLGIHTW